MPALCESQVNPYVQAKQLEDEVSHNGVALATANLCFGEGINLPIWLHIHLLLLLLQLLELLCTAKS